MEVEGQEANNGPQTGHFAPDPARTGCQRRLEDDRALRRRR